MLPIALAAFVAAPYALVKGPNGVVKAELFSTSQSSLPVARVGQRTVTLGELAEAISTTHEPRAPDGKPSAKKDFSAVLDRLIGMHLVLQEAEAMGIPELDEVKNDLEEFRKAALRHELQAIALRRVKADPKEVKRLYQDAVREWKLASVLVEKEEEAKKVSADAAGFEKRAGAAAWFSRKMKMLPQVKAALEKMQPGRVSAPIKVDKGFTVVRLLEVRYPSDPAAREEAREQALASRRSAALKAFYDRLVKKYARVDEKLLASIDFEAKEPGFQAFAKDQRPLATIEGRKPITVADLAAEAQAAFYHDVAHAISSKKVNKRKASLFDAVLAKQVVPIEIERRKIASSAGYRKRVSEFHERQIFTTFVQRVIAPDVKVTEGDLKRYYDAHKSDFTYPAFYRLLSLAFTTEAAADAALARLRAGSDFAWVKQNADGQVPPDKRFFDLDGNVVSERALTPEVRKAVAGAQNGDVRRVEQDGQHFVLSVQQVTPPSPQPYPEVRENIAPKVQAEMLNEGLQDWIAKLRKAHAVEVFITRIAS